MGRGFVVVLEQCESGFGCKAADLFLSGLLEHCPFSLNTVLSSSLLSLRELVMLLFITVSH